MDKPTVEIPRVGDEPMGAGDAVVRAAHTAGWQTGGGTGQADQSEES
jgi:hypothetical protein